MTLSIEVPDEMVEQLRLDDPEIGWRVLESLAVEAYRSQRLSRGQLSKILGLSFWETEALIKERGCGQGQTWAEVEEDVEKLRRFLGR
jgi:predicted HTH domain antitoxin